MRKTPFNSAIANLYNGIVNDASIKRYALGSNSLITLIECYHGVPKPEYVYFDDALVQNALDKCRIPELKNAIENFQRELTILKG